jgi:hypothetical protein
MGKDRSCPSESCAGKSSSDRRLEILLRHRCAYRNTNLESFIAMRLPECPRRVERH